MTLADHLRAVLATVNDKAHATPETQETIERARRALSDPDPPSINDCPRCENRRMAAAEMVAFDVAHVADQRAAFVAAMNDADQRGDE